MAVLFIQIYVLSIDKGYRTVQVETRCFPGSGPSTCMYIWNKKICSGKTILDRQWDGQTEHYSCRMGPSLITTALKHHGGLYNISDSM
uniref:Uncharacterized protein n=1 Tax=Magallana gigas TaxID=29159 RepID=K1PC27_MAGGI